jgi:3-methylcrotonyl-CoA carboxylase alpha subunit
MFGYENEPLELKAKDDELIKGDAGAIGSSNSGIVSPMPGRVVKIFAKAGDVVKEGDTLVAIESMKMEYLVKAKVDGTVGKMLVEDGATVNMKQKLVEME